MMLSSKTLSQFALILWGLSLALTGFSFYSFQRPPISGIYILGIGWLSPLLFNVAWFANIFFLYGIKRLISGKPAFFPAIFAVLFSLDLFRFERFPLNEAGSETPVYGYGWGAVLWLLSIAIMLAAAGSYRHESNENTIPKIWLKWLRPLGFVLFLTILGMSGYFYVTDREIANANELKRLEGIAFKRGKVCSDQTPTVGEPIANFTGTLLIIGDNFNGLRYSHFDIEELLRWGIPTIRFKGYDYYLRPDALADDRITEEELVEVQSSGLPSAILEVSTEKTKQGRILAINTKLTEASTNRLVFNQRWVREPVPSNGGRYHCPDYNSFPRKGEDPRRLVLEALRMQEK